MRFIYVMDEESKNTLTKEGYELIKADFKNQIWVFENKDIACFDLKVDCPYVLSDVLTF